jgi:hypothetical protein
VLRRIVMGADDRRTLHEQVLPEIRKTPKRDENARDYAVVR